MKFDCGKSYVKWTEARKQWHQWFAWFPVMVAERDCRWLEYVERKGSVFYGEADTWWNFEYRAIHNEAA